MNIIDNILITTQILPGYVAPGVVLCCTEKQMRGDDAPWQNEDRTATA